MDQPTDENNEPTPSKTLQLHQILAVLAVALGPLTVGIGKGYSSPAMSSLTSTAYTTTTASSSSDPVVDHETFHKSRDSDPLQSLANISELSNDSSRFNFSANHRFNVSSYENGSFHADGLLSAVNTVATNSSSTGFTASATIYRSPLINTDEPLILTVEQASWLPAASLLGACLITLPTGVALTWCGRRTVMAASAAVLTLAWCLQTFATTVGALYTAAVICGACSSVILLTADLYVAEISPPSRRGFFMLPLRAACSCGQLISWVSGPWLHWRHLALVAVVASILFLLAVWQMVPESALFVVARSQRPAACCSLRNLLTSRSDRKHVCDSGGKKREELKTGKLFHWLDKAEYSKQICIIDGEHSDGKSQFISHSNYHRSNMETRNDSEHKADDLTGTYDINDNNDAALIETPNDSSLEEPYFEQLHQFKGDHQMYNEMQLSKNRDLPIRTLAITCGLALIHKCSGTSAFQFYAAPLLLAASLPLHAAQSVAVGVLVAQIVASALVAARLVDRCGRVPVLATGCVVMATGSFIFGCVHYYLNRVLSFVDMETNTLSTNETFANSGFTVYSHLRTDDQYSGVPLAFNVVIIASLLLVQLAHAVCVSPVVHLIISEMFAMSQRGWSAVPVTVSYGCTFASVKGHVSLQTSLGLDGVFWVYSVVALAGLCFVCLLVPETSGVSLARENTSNAEKNEDC